MVRSFLPKSYLLMLDISLTCLYNATRQSKNVVLCLNNSAVSRQGFVTTSVFKNAPLTHSTITQDAFVLPLFINLCFVLLFLVLLPHISVAIFGGKIN